MTALWEALKSRARQIAVIAMIAAAISAALIRYQRGFEHPEKYGENRWPGYSVLEAFEHRCYDARMRNRGGRQPIQDRTSPVLLSFIDLRNGPQLIVKLRTKHDAVSGYLWEQLAPETQRLLKAYDIGDPNNAIEPDSALVEALLTDLNRLIEGECLYSEESFSGAALKQDTRALLAKRPEGDKLKVLNRLLLHDAYPAELSRDLILILGIDHASMQAGAIGSWPFPRTCHARVVNRLSEAGAKLICFDVDFSSKSARGSDAEELGEDEFTADDLAFAEAIEQAGNVILGANLEEQTQDDRGFELDYNQIYPINPLEDACLGTGFIAVIEDSDAFIRSLDTAWIDEAFDETLPYFGPMIAGTYEGLEWEEIGDWMHNKAKGKKPIPYAHDYETLINYIGPQRSFLTFPYWCVGIEAIPDTLVGTKTAEARKRLFENRIVFIGGTADELQDNKPTPYFQRAKTPGVEIHANATQMFLEQSYLRRAPSRVSAAVLLLMSFLTGVITVLVGRPVGMVATHIDSRLAFAIRGMHIRFYGIAWFLLYLMGAMVPPVMVFTLLNYHYFARQNLVLPLAYPLIGIAGTYFLGIFYMFLTEEQERKRMHGRFQRFVAPSVLTEILANRDDQPTARKVEATLIFTDLQGFTTLSEQMEPDEVVEVLNDYLDRMTEVIFKHEGTIDKFIGDAIMVIFGAPRYFEDHALRAVRCAVDMQEECSKFRAEGREKGWPDFFMRIGIHTDVVVVGSIGSSLRMDYTAIGDGVNLAARLEAANKSYGTWTMCSESTLERCGDSVEAEYLDSVTVKGKTEAVNVHQILRIKENGEPIGYDCRQIDLDQESSESAKKAQEAYGGGVGDH